MRTILSLLLSCAFSATVAQTTYLDVLFNVAPTHLHYGDQQAEMKDFRKGAQGLQAGVSFQAGINDRLSLVPEFFFMMKGGRLESGNPLNGQRSKIRLYSLDLPVLARVHFGKFYLNAGPSVSYNLGGKLKLNATESREKSNQKLQFGEEMGAYKRWEAGVQVGAGYEVMLKKSRLSFDLRYHLGLNSVVNGAELYNRYLYLSILVARPWKKNPLARKR